MASIDVDGMTCAVCVSRVESVILELDGISNVAVNLARGSANF
ncbi:MAG: heavy-metal-associated domain-containing protein, partial [Candidatus Poseidoniaceae archaeon]